ncbi:hypothetical protein [Rhizobium mesoamericanum]|uniref:hypothetical protein n=1 Tax=Rhizobium mesoamericanum TaxID=1079800 RepID=UPI0003FADEC5|nr:hypothetical protein [Rhizobium mesoamericanum]
MSGQWIVDETGLTGAGDYWIDKRSLLDMRDGLYEWPQHLCTKKWVDFADFCEGFEKALQFHRRRYSKRRLADTIAKCERQIAYSRDYEALSRELFPDKYMAKFQFWTLTEMQAVSDELRRRYAANDNRSALAA